MLRILFVGFFLGTATVALAQEGDGPRNGNYSTVVTDESLRSEMDSYVRRLNSFNREADSWNASMESMYAQRDVDAARNEAMNEWIDNNIVSFRKREELDRYLLGDDIAAKKKAWDEKFAAGQARRLRVVNPYDSTFYSRYYDAETGDFKLAVMNADYETLERAQQDFDNLLNRRQRQYEELKARQQQLLSDYQAIQSNQRQLVQQREAAAAAARQAAAERAARLREQAANQRYLQYDRSYSGGSYSGNTNSNYSNNRDNFRARAWGFIQGQTQQAWDIYNRNRGGYGGGYGGGSGSGGSGGFYYDEGASD
jgi:hypothetical protein